MDKIRIEYDKTWKEVVTHLIDPFIAFFLPDLYEQIDWRIAPEFLEKELHNAKNIKKSKRIVDKLVKVLLKNGEEKWVFIHIEFQSDGSTNIGLRMYDYYQLIRERYGKEIIALVIYTGESVPKQHNLYHQEYFGTSITYKYNDYAVVQQTESDLLANKNPFALVVLANLYLLETKYDSEKRYQLKVKMYELAKKRGYSVAEFTKLLIFVTELMKMPPQLERKFEKEVLQSPHDNHLNMYKNLSKSSLTLVSKMVESVYGVSMEDIKAKAEEEVQLLKEEYKLVKEEAKLVKEEAKLVKEEAKLVKEEAKLVKEEARKMDVQRTKSIILLYTRVDMSIHEIAEHLGLSNEVIEQILKKNKVLKK
jgi:AraC-like DNA-binding protein